MHHRFKQMALVLVLFVWLLTGCQTETPADPSQPQSARLSEVVGDVQIRNPGQTDFGPAEEGALLQEGGEVRTGPDGRARLDLSSGTIVRVPPDTSFVLAANAPAEDSLFTRLRLLAGQIWVALTGGSLEVETPGGTAAVRGSHLMVWLDPATMQVWVSCFEGQCSASNPAGSLDLSTGEGAVLRIVGEGETPPPPTARALTWDEFQAWASNVPEAEALLPEIVATLTAFPTATATAASTPTMTPTCTPTPGCALQLLSPANGAALPASGAVIFSWNSYSGAAKYQLQVISINGAINTFETNGTSLRLYIENLPAAGTYSWQVSALDAQGQVICRSASFTFTKPLTVWETSLPPLQSSSTPDPNTYFTLVEGPIGYPSEFCDQRYYKVIISDIHGINAAWLGYQVQDSMGVPICSGTLPLVFNSGMWIGNPVIPANPGDTVYWWFVATDGLYNNVTSEVYSYSEVSVCP